MAARTLRPKHTDEVRCLYRFYVYEVLDSSGNVLYVGKGTGRRMYVSKRFVGGSDCRVVAQFKREDDAYAYEVERIADVSPAVNKTAGGNGPRCQPVRARRWSKDRAEKEIESLGTRAYAARLALKKLRTIKHLASKVEIPAALIELVEKTDYRKLYEVAYG